MLLLLLLKTRMSTASTAAKGSLAVLVRGRAGIRARVGARTRPLRGLLLRERQLMVLLLLRVEHHLLVRPLRELGLGRVVHLVLGGVRGRWGLAIRISLR